MLRRVLPTAVAFVSACSESNPSGPHSPTVRPSFSGVSVGAETGLSLDEELLELGRRVPGFGGAYWDGTTVVIRLRDERDAATAEAVVRARLAVSGTELGAYREAPLSIQGADYLFSELYDWRRSIDDAGISGLVSTDVNETLNRVVVGVSSASAIEEVASVPTSKGWPSEALVVRLVPNPVPQLDSLIGSVIPTLNGVLITRPPNHNCTLGANVVLTGQSGLYFITASHCTETMLGLDTPSSQTEFYQPLPSFGPKIASTDFRDPAPSSMIAGCPGGYICRWSDAAALKYPSDTLWGGGIIALPVGSSGPAWVFVFALPIDQMRTPPAGTTVAKVGQNSGPTTGSPVQTCATYYPDSVAYAGAGVIIPGNLALLCQNQANYYSLGGDSGGPVFRMDYLWEPALFLGIHHAAGGWYSPLASLKKDLGAMKVDLY